MSALATGLTNLSGWVAYLVIAALVFGETAVFVGFVLPGEIAVVLGGVLASRGHVSLPFLIVIVVAAAIAGPFIGYEIGKRMGDRLFAAKALRRVQGGTNKARAVLSQRGGAAVLLGRFVAIVRAVMPAAAGASRVRYRTFAVYNVLGGLIWGVGYCMLGYLAGSAYAVVEKRVGTGLAIALGVLVVAAVVVWSVRRHLAASRPDRGPGLAAEPAGTEPVSTEPVSTEPVSTEPAGTEPAGAEPAS
ncbi:MAG: DedA family protein [Streptosporangiaceae bacterium]